MADIYKRRFLEIHQQMELILSSKKSTYSEFLGKNQIEIEPNALLEWKVKARSLLTKACGQDSEHVKEFLKNEDVGLYGTNLGTLERLKAILLAAKEDYEGGYLKSTRSLVQAEVFDSELEQARALLHAGYKSPAAIVAGVVLETSLRELSDRAGIVHAKLDKMNADLAKAGIYSTLLQKRITALAGVRNSAAHGKSEEFSEKDVEDMIRDVERFITENL
ncbi:hypothetical protein [Rheinheimera soli]|uniref:DUF4145 domain-containing protein n=1 Tax=Rheinheimera soli TaxID=443616 RepID=A0ABU1W135_9GAMM|nr:hypothetical protein [Rheinheimera soli]MDR7121676.1 hypothetical protein [Rheinheimera soli]